MPDPTSTLTPGLWCRVDAQLRKWGPLVLLILAICYYSQYYRSGLNLGGEGGTVAVNAIRLNEGWLPVKDTTLNYNVMWFYPVAWLFKLTGPNYIALRVYFFALCLVAGLLGFLIVRRVSGLGWYALGIAALIILIPGMMFRNYMGLLTLLNAWALLHAFVFEPGRASRRWLWFAIAGLALGITWLVRVDVGIFFTAIYLGCIALYPFGFREAFLRRGFVAAGGGAVCLAIAVALQIPFFMDASARGYRAEFVESYTIKWSYMKSEALRLLYREAAPALKSAPQRPAMADHPEWLPVRYEKTPKNWAKLAKEEHAQREVAMKLGRPRQSLRDIFKQPSFYDSVFVAILYLPLLVTALVVTVAGGALAWAICTSRSALKEPALVCLVTLGSALTIFSQYFFFRPDTPHLSEFMIPFLVSMACASFYAIRFTRATRSWVLRAAGVGFAGICALAQGLYFFHSFPKESAGTIAAAHRRSYEVVADNGVRVFMKRREQPWVQALHDTIVRYSTPSEWVVTFPYSPTINFMTNRPSYLKDLYIDNATAGPNTLQAKINEIEQFHPAVIVIDQRDINDTEISRFKNWAVPVYDYIRSHYVRIGKDRDFDENEIYVRPDKVGPRA